MPLVGESRRMRGPGLGATSYLLLAAQVLSLGRFLLVSHATCPEHGDVMHSGQPHEALVARPIANECLRPMVGAVPQAEDGHDHCRICTITHERFALLPPARAGAKSIELPVGRVARSVASPLPPVAVIAFSPKTSPPSA